MEGGEKFVPKYDADLAVDESERVSAKSSSGWKGYFELRHFFNELKDKVNSALREENQQLWSCAAPRWKQ